MSYSQGLEVEVRHPKKEKKTLWVHEDELPDSDRAPLLASTTSYGSVDSRGSMITSFCEELPDDVAIRVKYSSVSLYL